MHQKGRYVNERKRQDNTRPRWYRARVFEEGVIECMGLGRGEEEEEFGKSTRQHFSPGTPEGIGLGSSKGGVAWTSIREVQVREKAKGGYVIYMIYNHVSTSDCSRSEAELN